MAARAAMLPRHSEEHAVMRVCASDVIAPLLPARRLQLESVLSRCAHLRCQPSPRQLAQQARESTDQHRQVAAQWLSACAGGGHRPAP
eukprot:2025847-Rhodomonas_salina.5